MNNDLELSQTDKTSDGSTGVRWHSMLLTAVIAAVACLSLTSEAQAWGTCGRGAWVSRGPVFEFGAYSTCTCTNGLSGATSYYGVGQRVQAFAWGGPTTSGVGMEAEMIDTKNGRKVAHGLGYLQDSPVSLLLAVPMSTDFTGNFAFLPPDLGRYQPTGRFRAVCVTNYPSLPARPSYPWIWN